MKRWKKKRIWIDSIRMRLFPCIVLFSLFLPLYYLSSLHLSSIRSSSSSHICSISDSNQCPRPFVPFKQRYRFSRSYGLIGCAIEKNFSTLLTAILCFLHDEDKFIRKNRDLVKEEFHHRFCGPRNEDKSIERAIKRVNNNNTSIFAITREPIDRFISGFVDKCIKERTWEKHRDRCCGCKDDLNCFIEQMYKRILKKSHGNKQRTTFDDDHFFPQSWRCEFSSNMKKYKLLHFSAKDPIPFYSQLFNLFRSQGVPESSISLIEFSISHNRTQHSTIQSEERIIYENKLRSSSHLMKLVTRMYYYDFILFNYPIPDLS